MRMAKSCGPDASTLASSFAVTRDDGDKKARSPGRARRKPLKPLRAGMPGESGEPVVTTSCAHYQFRTRDCGCIKHPAFPTPFFLSGGQFVHDSGAFASRECGAASCCHCERSEAIHLPCGCGHGLLRGACHRAALCADPLTRMMRKDDGYGADCFAPVATTTIEWKASQPSLPATNASVCAWERMRQTIQLLLRGAMDCFAPLAMTGKERIAWRSLSSGGACPNMS